MELPESVVRLVRALPEPALLVSAGGSVLLINRAAREALAWHGPAGELPFLHELFDEQREDLNFTLRRWARSSDASPGALTRSSDGTPLIYNASGCTIVPGEGDVPALIFIRFWKRAAANPFLLLNQKIIELNDEIARRAAAEEAVRRNEAALRDRVAEAEALSRTKDEFVATVSHELRTPLNAILGWATLLGDRKWEDAQLVHALEVIRRNAEAQALIIDDILDVSRIITGKLMLDTVPTDLQVVIDDAIEVVRPSAAAKGIQLIVEPMGEQSMLTVDPDRIRQVVWNLLANAVKFTPPGGRIVVELEHTSSRYELRVRDTGQGIQADFLPFVFERFKQADSSITRRNGGIGLGLAIVRHIVELHGGTVAVHSDGPGKGACFTIGLPVRAIATTPALHRVTGPAQTAREHASVALTALKILVVDDEPDARSLLAALLGKCGAVVETAGNVSEAMEAIALFAPDVLVSDIGMPDEDGYSLIGKVRRLAPQEGATIPAVALTAYTRAQDAARALSAGFSAHIGKPVNPDDLLTLIARLVDEGTGRRLAPRS